MSDNTLDPGAEDLPEIDGQPMDLEAAPAVPDTMSAKDLAGDILGGEDFDLPPPPPGAGNAQVVSKPLSTFTPLPKPATAPGAPASSPFKLPSSPFKAPGSAPSFASQIAMPQGAPQPMGPPPSAPVLAPVAMPVAAPFSLAEVSRAANWDDVKAALQAPAAPAKIPGDMGVLAFHLCRALVKKGVISVDELFADMK